MAEASLALVSAQRDQIVAASESDQSTLEETAEAWRVDREQLAEAQGRIKQLQVQVEIAAANGKREDAANAQQLEREKAVAKLAAEHGAREMDAIRTLLWDRALDGLPDTGGHASTHVSQPGGADEDDDVECTGERTREERDAEGRKNAVVLEEDEDE